MSSGERPKPFRTALGESYGHACAMNGGRAKLNRCHSQRPSDDGTCNCPAIRPLKLTKRERTVLAMFDDPNWDEVNEGLICDECWPLIRNVRLVTNSLERKGLIKFGQWWDEEIGCILHRTDAGRDAVASAPGGGEQSDG